MGTSRNVTLAMRSIAGDAAFSLKVSTAGTSTVMRSSWQLYALGVSLRMVCKGTYVSNSTLIYGRFS